VSDDRDFPRGESLVEALERRAREDAARDAFLAAMEQRLGTDWWTLPPEEIDRTAADIATARGAPETAPALAQTAELNALSRLFIRRVDTATPGIEHPKPREVWERVFLELVEERYG
jgi:hypothetical protein